MVTVHPYWLPAAAVEITFCDQPSRFQQKNQVAKPVVFESKSKTSQFAGRQDAPAIKAVQLGSKLFASCIIEKPEARHRRVVNREVVGAELQPDRLYIRHEIVLPGNRRHAVVGA